MLEAVDTGVRSLQACAAACGLYGAEHAAPRAAAQRTVEALGRVLAGRPELSVALLDDRAVFEGQELPSGSEIVRASLGNLRFAGIEHLTLLRGLSVEDVLALAQQIATRTLRPDASPSPRVRFGRLATGSGRSQAGAHAVTPDQIRVQAARLPEIWSCIEQAGRIELGELDGLLVEIAAGIAANAGSTIPLANLKSHDEYTFIHATNVGLLAAALGEAVGLPENHVRDLTIAALLHDVGKARVPAAVLNKQGKLDDAEFALIRRHPVDGARMLAGARGVPALAVVVAYEHHCLPDGGGYPRRPPGRTMHLASHITQIADVFDALRTDRPYRPAMSIAEARTLMYTDQKARYEPELLEAFYERVVPNTPGARAPDADAAQPLPRAAA